MLNTTLLSVFIVSLSSLLIGYTAQVTGLCLVRGVSDWSKGSRLRLVAILSSGFWVYIYFPLAHFSSNSLGLVGYGFQSIFLLGGGLFGLGSALNGACSVSTVTRLSSGDVRMLFTIAGWLIGWLLLDYSGLRVSHRAQPIDQSWLAWVAPGGLVIAWSVVYWRYRHQLRLWSGIMLVGVLAGAIFLYQPAWSPSDFVRDLGLAIIRKDATIVPSIDRLAILFLMVAGMSLGAWQYQRFHWHLPNTRSIVKHLASGTLMGVGSAMALGGNDFQLLLALPAASAAGASATLGMLLGIRLGLALINRYSNAISVTKSAG